MFELHPTSEGHRLYEQATKTDTFFNRRGEVTATLHLYNEVLTLYLSQLGPEGPMPNLPAYARAAERLQLEDITHVAIPRVSVSLAQTLHALGFTARNQNYRFLSKNNAGYALLSRNEASLTQTQLRPLTTAALALELPPPTPTEEVARHIIRYAQEHACTSARHLPPELHRSEAIDAHRDLLRETLNILKISALQDEPHPNLTVWLWHHGHPLTHLNTTPEYHSDAQATLGSPHLQIYAAELRRWSAALLPHVNAETPCTHAALQRLNRSLNTVRASL